MENARRCVVAVLARGTNSWPAAKERRARRQNLLNAAVFLCKRVAVCQWFVNLLDEYVHNEHS